MYIRICDIKTCITNGGIPQMQRGKHARQTAKQKKAEKHRQKQLAAQRYGGGDADLLADLDTCVEVLCILLYSAALSIFEVLCDVDISWCVAVRVRVCVVVCVRACVCARARADLGTVWMRWISPLAALGQRRPRSWQRRRRSRVRREHSRRTCSRWLCFRQCCRHRGRYAP